MNASNKLSEDMDLVKEFESLRLKQSLLLESLKHKKKQEENDSQIKEIHQLVQQLLDVFLEAKENQPKKSEDESKKEEDDKTSPELETLNRLEDKIDSLQKDMSELQRKIKPSNFSSSKIDESSKDNLSHFEISNKIESLDKESASKNKEKKIVDASNNLPIPKAWKTKKTIDENKL